MLGVERLDQRLLQLGLNFFERLGRNLLIKALEERLPLGRSQIFQDVGEIGRVHLGEAILIDLEANTAGGIDQVDKLPRDDAGAEARGDGIDSGRG